MGKFHDFLWETDKPEFTLRRSFLIPETALRVFRAIGFILCVFTYVWTTHDFLMSLAYLTNWGIIFTGAYFLCSSLCYFIYKEDDDVDVKKPFTFWKFTSVLCELAFSMEVLILIYYWALLYPDTPEEHVGIRFWNTIFEHAVTPVLIYLEVIFGGNRFYKRHVIFMILVGSLYVLTNFAATKITGEPVYSNLTWESIETFYFLLAAIGLSLFGFAIGLGISSLKNKKRVKETEGIYRNI